MKVDPYYLIDLINRLPKEARYCDCRFITKAIEFPFIAIAAVFSRLTVPFRWAATRYRGTNYSEEYENIVKADVPLNQVDFSVGKQCLYENRYFDVLPNEATRVKSENDPFFYFNANWVLEKTVIATQGPRLTDHPAFWKMVLEHKIGTIIMLTDLREKGMEKCTNYWDAVGKKTEEVIYTNGAETIVKRELGVGPERKSVVQYHLQNFPDHGIVKAETLAHLVRITAKSEGVILAHCSAGIGRTGTYCAALGAYRRKSLDMCAIVKELRNPMTGRCLMVQTPAQYALAYETAKLIVASLPSRVWSAVWRSNRVS